MGGKQVERAAAIARIVRDADLRILRQVGDGFHLARIEADGLHEGEADGHDPVAAGRDLRVEIGLVLEGVGVEVLALQGLVDEGVVGEGHELDVQALAGRDLLHNLRHLFLGARHDADLDVLLLSKSRQCSDGAERDGGGQQGTAGENGHGRSLSDKVRRGLNTRPDRLFERWEISGRDATTALSREVLMGRHEKARHSHRSS